MEPEKMSIQYNFSSSAISDITDINSSFAKGRLKVMYLGKNRNKTFFDEEDVQRALPTLRNVPIVCNWMADEGIIGGHDMGKFKDADGKVRLINLTDPCGVVPESAKFSIETELDENGVGHKYLIADGVILWKRQDVYQHIKNDLNGKVDHSMEIDIFKRQNKDGVMHIKDFQFTALCLLERDAPCFEGSELELYSACNNTEAFKEKFNQMLQELSEINMVNSSVNEGDNTEFSSKGGTELEEKLELVNKYGIKVEDLDFSLEDVSMEELEEKLKAYSTDNGTEPEATPEPEGTADPEPAPAEPEATPEPTADPEPAPEPEATPAEGSFALESVFREELYKALEVEKVETEWGSFPRYSYVDCNKDTNEVYAFDMNDWTLYGFKYTVNGDAVSVDFDSKSRKKFEIVDFVDGEAAGQFSQISEMFSKAENKIKENAEALAKFSTLEAEVEELRKFKADVEETANANAREEVLARFSMLNGNEMFEALVSSAKEHTVEDLEEKCYAILGRVNAGKFSLKNESKAPKLAIEKPEQEDAPYGGIVEKYLK